MKKIEQETKNPGIMDYLKDNLRNELFEVILKVIHTPHLILKAYLFIFVIISSGLAAYTVVESLISYFDYEATTTSRTISESPTLFPKVTICNLKPFTTQYALKILKEFDPSVSFLNMDQVKAINTSYAKTMEQISGFSLKVNGFINNKNFSDRNRKELSHSLKDILLSCSFNLERCSANNFTWKFDSTYGNCYEFNSGFDASGHKADLIKSSVVGQMYGLSLEIYSNYYENLTILNKFNGGSGLLIRIDNSSYLTDHNYDGIRASPGVQTDIIIDRSSEFNLPKPYSDCEIDDSYSATTFDSDLFTLIAKSQYKYTQQLCLGQCFQKHVIKYCNCTDTLLSLYDVDYCTTNDQLKCLVDVFVNKFISNDFLGANCLPLCPLECYQRKFKVSTSMSRLSGDLYADFIKQNKNLSDDFVTKSINTDTAKDSITAVNIYYGSLSYTLSTESPKLDLVSLLATIGGNLGLFLGLSLFTLCEIIEILIDLYFLKRRKKISDEL